MTPITLSDLVARFLRGPICMGHVDEPWKQMIKRIKIPGRLAQVTPAVYRYFLEVLPPKFIGSGFYAFAEGQEPLKLFFRTPRLFLVRQLTWEETELFCAAAGIPLPN